MFLVGSLCTVAVSRWLLGPWAVTAVSFRSTQDHRIVLFVGHIVHFTLGQTWKWRAKTACSNTRCPTGNLAALVTSLRGKNNDFLRTTYSVESDTSSAVTRRPVTSAWHVRRFLGIDGGRRSHRAAELLT